MMNLFKYSIFLMGVIIFVSCKGAFEPESTSGFDLNGIIRDAKGKPVSGIVVEIVGNEYRDTSDKNGQWRLSSEKMPKKNEAESSGAWGAIAFSYEGSSFSKMDMTARSVYIQKEVREWSFTGIITSRNDSLKVKDVYFIYLDSDSLKETRIKAQWIKSVGFDEGLFYGSKIFVDNQKSTHHYLGAFVKDSNDKTIAYQEPKRRYAYIADSTIQADELVLGELAVSGYIEHTYEWINSEKVRQLFADVKSESGNKIVKYEWDVGSGYQEGTQTYENFICTGWEVVVKLRLTDGDGNTAELTKDVYCNY